MANSTTPDLMPVCLARVGWEHVKALPTHLISTPRTNEACRKSFYSSGRVRMPIGRSACPALMTLFALGHSIVGLLKSWTTVAEHCNFKLHTFIDLLDPWRDLTPFWWGRDLKSGGMSFAPNNGAMRAGEA